MPSLHDTRLLSNLLKTEKDTMLAFKHYTLTASSAGAALSAWSTADSADTADLMDASVRISQLLSTCTDAQRLYLHALAAYRASLKEVLDKETSIRTVVRDREILVNRLIKIGNKKPKDDAMDQHQLKLEDAQMELAACETFLQEEEAALSQAKRRSFREALAMRMKSMGELGRVMEESAAEAVEILTHLEGPEGFKFNPDDYKNDHNYDFASEAGDSITPSHSASQAMSRASSSSSLNGELEPPLPLNDLRIDGRGAGAQGSQSLARVPAPNGASAERHRRVSTNGDATASGASTPSHPVSRAPPAPRPIMPPVPTAPRPISSTVYTERQPGLPTFDIPKAPDLSRRPDDSSDEEEEPTALSGGGYDGLPPGLRSSHYPLDSPALGGGGARLRRRAMSDSSSILGRKSGGGKRRGSFFGGLAALFKRKDKRTDEDTDGGDVDYYAGRSRLNQSFTAGGGSGGDWSTRTDRNVAAAVIGAGLPRPRRGREDSSDDDEPKNLVRVVNDPKQRLKAMSDLGRVSAPTSKTRRSASVAPVTGRPVLSRKDTSQSTVRPMSMITAPTAPTGEKKKRKVKKAASDVGVTTAGWSTTIPVTAAPRMPSSNGTRKASTPAVTPAPSTATVTPAPLSSVPLPHAGPASIKTKKSKKSTKEHPQTVILSAEALGIPTTNASAAPQLARPTGALSRSNTATTSGTGGPKRKKKTRAASIGAGPGQQHDIKPLPTAEDLAATLPYARSSFSALTTALPRPDDDPYSSRSTRPIPTTAVSEPPISTAAPPAPASKPLKKLAAEEKRNKTLAARHGEGNWTTLPASVHAVGANHPAHIRNDAHEGDESLLSLVDRAEGADSVKPSRMYSAGIGASSLDTALPTAISGQSTAANTVLPRPPSGPVVTPSPVPAPVLSALPAPVATPAWAANALHKRKSVRLADGPSDSLAPNSKPHSPPSSVRSASSTTPRPGILINSPSREPSPAPPIGIMNGGAAWPTRASIRAQMDDSSDEEEMRAYRDARKMLGRGTREMEEAMGVRGPKGKGKATV
ncbi:hypothetical protein JCM21900_003972 [Sporobolomyces salmonicolor]